MIPARPYKPKDKAKAEVGVQIVERWILARLRKQNFFSLAELNQAIRALLEELNQKPFKQLPGNRREAFERLDRPALKALPKQPYRYVDIKQVKVQIDYCPSSTGTIITRRHISTSGKPWNCMPANHWSTSTSASN